MVDLGDVRDTNADQLFIDYEQLFSGSNLQSFRVHRIYGNLELYKKKRLIISMTQQPVIDHKIVDEN